MRTVTYTRISKANSQMWVALKDVQHRQRSRQDRCPARLPNTHFLHLSYVAALGSTNCSFRKAACLVTDVHRPNLFDCPPHTYRTYVGAFPHVDEDVP